MFDWHKHIFILPLTDSHKHKIRGSKRENWVDTFDKILFSRIKRNVKNVFWCQTYLCCGAGCRQSFHHDFSISKNPACMCAPEQKASLTIFTTLNKNKSVW